MKSLQVMHANYIDADDKKNYSDLIVMHSGAGYYVGTIYHNPDGFDEPGSRDTDYFKTEAEAKIALAAMEDGSYTGYVRLKP